MTNYEVAPWVAAVVIAFTVGRTCIGFPDWVRQQLGRKRARLDAGGR